MKRPLFFALFFAFMFVQPVTAGQDKVDIFVTSWCPYCKKLERFLKQNDIAYTRYDVETDTKGNELFYELGGEGVPLARVNSKIIHGYDPEAIKAALSSK